MKKLNFFETVLLKIFGGIIKHENEEQMKLFKEENEKSLNEAIEELREYEFEQLNKRVDPIEKLLTPEKVEHIKDPKLIPSSDGRFHVRIDHSGKDHLTLHTSKPIITEGVDFLHFEFPKKPEGHAFPMAFRTLVTNLYETGECMTIVIKPFSVLVTKSPAVKWDNLMSQSMVEIFDILEKKYPAVKKEELTA